jgi:hypothetical protein
LNVGDEHVDRLVGEDLQCLFAVVRQAYRSVGTALHGGAEEVSEVRVVFDDQHDSHLGHRFLPSSEWPRPLQESGLASGLQGR